MECLNRLTVVSELMWCDFDSTSIQLVNRVNITDPSGPFDPPARPRTQDLYPPPPPPRPTNYPPHGPPTRYRRPGRGMFFPSAWSEWSRSTSHRSTKAQPFLTLHPAGLVTFYHPRLTSLVTSRVNQTVAQHRIYEHISNEDALSMRDEVDKVLQRGWPGSGSGMDWSSLSNNMVEYWSSRIAHIQFLLTNITNTTNTIQTIWSITHSLVAPYTDTGNAQNTSSWDLFFGQKDKMGLSAFDLCSSESTGFLQGNPMMTEQEELLRSCIYTIQHRLCADLGTIFVSSSHKNSTMSDMQAWLGRINTSLEWLDWPIYARCEDVCARDVSSRSYSLTLHAFNP